VAQRKPADAGDAARQSKEQKARRLMPLPPAPLFLPTGSPLRSVDDILAELGIDPAAQVRVNGMLLPEEAAALERVRLSQFFLVRNDGSSGERWPCGRHKDGLYDQPVYHSYFTLMCIERPFRGLRDALFAYAKASSDDGLERRMLRQFPELRALGHPGTGKKWAPEMPGEQLLAVVLGRAEPIPGSRARLLEVAINARRPPERFIL